MKSATWLSVDADAANSLSVRVGEADLLARPPNRRASNSFTDNRCCPDYTIRQGVLMPPTLSNIEPIARAACMRRLQGKCEPQELPALVERYWHVIAALVEAGLVDEGANLRCLDIAAGEAAYCDWLSRYGARTPAD